MPLMTYLAISIQLSTPAQPAHFKNTHNPAQPASRHWFAPPTNDFAPRNHEVDAKHTVQKNHRHTSDGKSKSTKKHRRQIGTLVSAITRFMNKTDELDRSAVREKGLLAPDAFVNLCVERAEKNDDGSLVLHGRAAAKSAYSFKHFITREDQERVASARSAVNQAIRTGRAELNEFQFRLGYNPGGRSSYKRRPS